MPDLTMRADFLMPLLHMAGYDVPRRNYDDAAARRMADRLEAALDDIPEGEIPADEDAGTYEFYAGHRRGVVKHIAAVLRMYGGFRLTTRWQNDRIWFTLIFEELTHA